VFAVCGLYSSLQLLHNQTEERGTMLESPIQGGTGNLPLVLAALAGRACWRMLSPYSNYGRMRDRTLVSYRTHAV